MTGILQVPCHALLFQISHHRLIMSATCVKQERCGAGSACTPPPHKPSFLVRSSRFHKKAVARGCA